MVNHSSHWDQHAMFFIISYRLHDAESINDTPGHCPFRKWLRESRHSTLCIGSCPWHPFMCCHMLPVFLSKLCSYRDPVLSNQGSKLAAQIGSVRTCRIRCVRVTTLVHLVNNPRMNRKNGIVSDSEYLECSSTIIHKSGRF